MSAGLRLWGSGCVSGIHGVLGPGFRRFHFYLGFRGLGFRGLGFRVRTKDLGLSLPGAG